MHALLQRWVLSTEEELYLLYLHKQRCLECQYDNLISYSETSEIRFLTPFFLFFLILTVIVPSEHDSQNMHNCEPNSVTSTHLGISERPQKIQFNLEVNDIFESIPYILLKRNLCEAKI